MKGMVESEPVVNGAPIDSDRVQPTKVVVNGEAVQENGLKPTSSGDLQLHIPLHSDDEEDQTTKDSSVAEGTQNSDAPKDLENNNDPKPITLAAKSLGANLINMYKDSAENSLETCDSVENEVNPCVVESKAILKSVDVSELTGPNNFVVKGTNKPDESSKGSETVHLEISKNPVEKNVSKNVSDNSPDLVKEEANTNDVNTCPAKNEVPQIIKEESLSECTDPFVKKETLNSESHNTNNAILSTSDSPTSNCLTKEFDAKNLLESKVTPLNVTEQLLVKDAIDSDSGRESCLIDNDESTAKNIRRNETDLLSNENPCLSVVIDNDATELSCNKPNELLTAQNGNGGSFTENSNKDSNDCDTTELEDRSEKGPVLSEDTELVPPLIKDENQEMMVESVDSVSSSVSQDKETIVDATSPEEEKTNLALISNEPSSLPENEDFELKLECSDDSQDAKNDLCSESDETFSDNLCKTEHLVQKTDGNKTMSRMMQKDPVSIESNCSKVNVNKEINKVFNVSDFENLKVHDSEILNNEQDKTKELEEENEETPDSLSTDIINPSAETGPDNAMDVLASEEETLVNNDPVTNDMQKPHSPRATSVDVVAVKQIEDEDNTVLPVSVNDNEHVICNSELVHAKSTNDLSIQPAISDSASEDKMTGSEDKVEKPENVTETDSVIDLNNDIREPSMSPKLTIDEDTEVRAEATKSENKPIEQTLKQSDISESCSLETETLTNAVDGFVIKSDDTLSVKSINESCDGDKVEEQHLTDSCSTNKSDSSESKQTSIIKKSDGVFDKLLSSGVKETADESDCTSRKPTSPSGSCGESDTKERDGPITSVEGTSAASTDLEDGSDDIILSSENDDSRGFPGIGQKRLPPIESPVEPKRPKLVNSHETVSTKEVRSQSPAIKRSSELGEISTSKKSRIDSAQVPSIKSSENVSKQSENNANIENCSMSSQSSRKSLSNIDKAIERVAFGGLDRKERVMMPFIKDLKNKRLQDITVDDLEELVTQRMAEVLSDSGENGILREKVQKLERMTEFWKHKATSLQKQLSDMTMVFKKLATETKQNSSQLQIPIKITRSVGLQVMMPQTQSGGKSNTHVRNGLPPGTKRKSGGIITNRNTTPNIHYPSPTTTAPNLTPNRPPLVQKVIAPPIPTSTPVKVSQAVPTVKSPVIGPPTSTVRFRSPSTVVSSVITGTVTTAASNQRTVSTVANRSLIKTAPPRPANDMLIDLTDEDDKTKRVATSTALPTTLRLAQFNGTPQTQGGTIRIVSPQQLASTTTSVNGQRLAYMLPASAANAATGRLQLFTQQTGGNLRTGSVLTVRPNAQTLTLKNGTVISSTTAPSAIIRAASGGTFQQVVSRPAQMRNIQPANRVANGQFNRTNTILTESPVNRPLVAVPSGHSQHPAPLPHSPPELPSSPNWKKAPPRPDLKISKVDTRDQHGIILSWNMEHGPEHEEIASYQLYAYQENSGPPLTSLWKKVGDVKAMPLPMACTLTQFLEGNKYHFAVRAVDIHSRCGMFSIPGHIILPRRVTS